MRVAILVLMAGCGFRTGAGSELDDAAGSAADALANGDAMVGDALIDGPLLDLIREAESANMLTMPRVHSWAPKTDKAGFSGASFMELVGGNGSVCPANGTDTVALCAAAMFYDVLVPAAGDYTLHLRMWADTAALDSVFVTIDDPLSTTTQTVDVMEDQTWRWTKSAGTSVYTLTVGLHRIGVLHREGGARVDKLALTTNVLPPP